MALENDLSSSTRSSPPRYTYMPAPHSKRCSGDGLRPLAPTNQLQTLHRISFPTCTRDPIHAPRTTRFLPSPHDHWRLPKPWHYGAQALRPDDIQILHSPLLARILLLRRFDSSRCSLDTHRKGRISVRRAQPPLEAPRTPDKFGASS